MANAIDPGSPATYTAYPTSSGTSPDYRTPLGGLTPKSFLDLALNQIHTKLPDYNKIIEDLMAPLREANKAKLAQLGLDTDFQKKLAQENARIAQEQLAQVHKRTVHQIVNNLTGRGLGESGEKPYQVDFENDTFGRATRLAANQLLALLYNLEAQYRNAGLDATAEEKRGLLAAQQYAHENYSPDTHYDPWAVR